MKAGERGGRRGRDRRLFELPVAEDVDRELRFHIDMRADELMAAGWEAAAARAEAQRLFGNVDDLGAECREVEERSRSSRRRTRLWEAVVQDVRFGVRTLVKTPVLTGLAVLTLALGMGANTAIFSVVNGVLLRPLGYPEPSELVALWEVTEAGRQQHVSTPNFRDWRARSRTLEGLAAHPSPSFWGMETVLGGSEAARVRVAPVTQDFFAVLGVAAQMGRTLGESDHRLDGGRAVVVSHAFWQRWLGAERDATGHALRVGAESYEVVGVMPPAFDYPAGADAWVAAEVERDDSERSAHNWRVVGRLREGETLESAQREMAAIGARLKAEYGDDNDAATVRVLSLHDELVGAMRRPLLLLLGGAGLVLLIACTNLATALLARGSAREAEVAVRASLGASRGRILQQFLAEALLLGLIGGLAGLALGGFVIRGLSALAPATLPRADELRLDGAVLAFTMLTTFATAILFGLAPAVRASGVALGGTMRAAGRGNSGVARSGWWGLLVGGEVAIAVVLLVGAGLLIRSFVRVVGIDPGFDAHRVLLAELSLPESRFPDDERVAAFHSRVLEEVRRLPGVESVGVINHLPLSGASINGSFDIEGREPESASASYRIASADYFDALGIPLLAGRTFAASDRAGAPDVAVVNRALADLYWPGEDPIGKRIRNLGNDRHVYGDRWLTIVGVVGDVRHRRLTGPPDPEIYVHYAQRPARIGSGVLAIRSSAPADVVAPRVRRALAGLEPDVPVELSLMEEQVAQSLADRRFTTLVLASFAGLALLLASVGIYGVVSCAVASRTREIGIRLALGVQPRRVRWLMQRRALLTVLAGALAGLVVSVALTRLLTTLLFESSPTDPLTFAAVLLLLVAVAWLASYIPARRVTRVDPMIVLRTE